MYNLFPYNQQPYNTAPKGISETIYTGDLKVGDIDLKAEGFVVSFNDEPKGGKRRIKKNMVPGGHGSIATGDYFTEKLITMKGKLRRSDKTDLMDSIDRYLHAFSKENIDLLTRRNCEDLRKYNVKLINTDQCFLAGKHYHVNHADFEFKFLCLTPFGEDIFEQSGIIANQTDLDLPFEIAYGGSAVGWVDFTITINTEADISGIKMQKSDGSMIEIVQEFNDNDTIEISGENGTVKVNGSEVDYNGTFHELFLGGNSFNLISTGTSINFDLAHKFKNRYH